MNSRPVRVQITIIPVFPIRQGTMVFVPSSQVSSSIGPELLEALYRKVTVVMLYMHVHSYELP